MANPLVLTDCRIFAGGADLTGQSNKVEVKPEVETKPVTTFASGGYREVKGGLGSCSVSGEGYWEAGDLGKIDNQAWASLGAQDAYSFFPTLGGVGDLAWLVRGHERAYQFLDAVGEVNPWKLDIDSSWPLVRGKGMHPASTARTATGDGTAVELAAVAADRYLYACLHVLSVAGSGSPTITVKIQSDSGSGMASPTDVLTFDAATAIGGQSKRVIGPITDTWFRASWTISGTTPSFLFVVTLGIK